MAVEARNGGLSWKAGIDTSELEKDAKRIEQTFDKLGKKNAATQKQMLTGLASEFQKIGKISNESFLSATPQIQKQSIYIQKLTTELGKVTAAQKNLNANYESGKIKTSQYNAQAAALAATERDLKNQISLESTALKQNMLLMDQSKGSIKAMQIQLNALRQSLSGMTDAQITNTQQGRDLVKNIVELESKINTANNRVKELAATYNQSVTSVNAYKQELSKLTSEYDKLSLAERKSGKGVKNLAAQSNIQEQINQSERLKRTTLENLTIFSQTSQSIENLGQRVAILTQRYGQLTVAQAKDPNVGGKIQEQIRGYQQQIDSVNKYNQALSQNIAIQNMANGSLEQKRAKLALLQVQYSRLTEAELKNKAVGGQLAAQIRSLDRDVSKYGASLSTTAKSSRLFNQIMIATAGIFSITQGTRLIGDIIRTRGEIEQLEVAFTTMLKSKSAADDLMREIVDVATTTPFKLTEVASATKQLLAYGFAQKEIKGELLAIGNIASGVGSSFQEVAYAYGTLKAQGRAYMRDIRQFTTRGIPIMQELANVLNTTTDNVQNLVEAGKVGFPEVQKAFQNLTGVGGQFFNLMEKQSQTVTGEIAKLQDRIQLMFNDIGKGNEGLIKGGISGLSFLVENYEEVIKIIELLIITYGSYRAALIVTAALEAAQVASGIKVIGIKTALALATNRLRAAQQALNATMAANPYILVATVLAGLIASFVLFRDKIEEAEQVQERLNRVGVETTKIVGDQEAKIKTLISTLSNQNIAESVRLKAYNDLKDISPDIVKGLDFEEAKTEDLTKAVYGYIDALEKRLRVENLTNEAVKLRGEIFEKEQQLIKSQDFQKHLKETGGDVLQVGARSSRYQDEVDRGNKIAKELENLYNQEIKIGDQINENLDNSEESTKKRIAFLERLKKSVDETSAAYKKYEDEITSLQKTIVVTETTPIQNKAYFEKIVEENTEALEMLDKSAEDFENKSKAYKEKIIEAQKNLDAFGLKGEKDELKKEEKDQKQALKEREKILNELNNLEDKAYKKSFDKREQEKADLKRQLDELRQLAKDAGFGAGVLTRIDNLELNATGNIDYRNDTEKLKEEFEKRKTLYEQYENHVRDFGVSSAENRYRSELDTAKNYISQIQDEYNNLLGISVSRSFTGGSLTGPESERLRAFKIILDAEKKEQEDQLNALLKANQSYEQQRKTLYENAARDRVKIAAKNDTQALATFEKNFQESIENLNESAAKDLSGFTKFFDNVDVMSRKAALNGVETLRKKLKQLLSLSLEDGGITPEDFAKLDAELVNLTYNLKNEVPDGLSKIAQGIGLITSNLTDSNSGLANMAELLNTSLGAVIGIKKNMADLQKARASGDSAGVASAGLGIFGAIIGVFKAAENAFNKAKDERMSGLEQALDFQRSLLSGELELNRIYRERSLEAAFNEDRTLKSLKDQREVLLQSQKEIKDSQNEINAIFGENIGTQADYLTGIQADKFSKRNVENLLKELGQQLYVSGTKEVKGGFLGLGKKTINVYESLAGLSFDEIEALSFNKQLTEEAEKLFQELVKLKEEGKNVEEQLKAIDDQLTDIFTGGLTASGLADGIISEFQGAGSQIEEILRNAILSGFKYRFLEAPLNDLIDQFAEDAQSGGELTTSEIDAFTNAYSKLSDDAKKALEQLEASTGINLSNPQGTTGNETGISKAIKAITTEQASELTGLFRGFYDLTKIGNNISYEHLAVANSQLSATMAIQTNTAQTVERLDSAIVELRLIVKNTKGGQSDRGLGIGED